MVVVCGLLGGQYVHGLKWLWCVVYQAGRVAGHTAGGQYVCGLGAVAQPGAQRAAVLHSGETTASPLQPPALQWLRYVVTSLSPGSWRTLPHSHQGAGTLYLTLTRELTHFTSLSPGSWHTLPHSHQGAGTLYPSSSSVTTGT